MLFVGAIILDMNNKVATGIKELDNQLLGGLPKKQLTILEGSAGTGKTIFGLQFLKEGLFTDERVLYITSKDTPKQIREIINSLDWDIAWAFEQGRFIILDIRDYFGESETADSSDIFVNLITEISGIIAKNNIKRVVMDPAFPQFVKENNSTRKIYFSGLNGMIEKSENDLTIILIQNDSDKESNIETNIIKMYFEKQGQEIKRYLLPQKVMFTEYSVKASSFEIKTKDGIWVNE